MKLRTILILISIILIVNLLIGGVATEYVIEFWVGKCKGNPVDVPFIPCAIAGVFVGELTIPAAILTWILSGVI